MTNIGKAIVLPSFVKIHLKKIRRRTPWPRIALHMLLRLPDKVEDGPMASGMAVCRICTGGIASGCRINFTEFGVIWEISDLANICISSTQGPSPPGSRSRTRIRKMVVKDHVYYPRQNGNRIRYLLLACHLFLFLGMKLPLFFLGVLSLTKNSAIAIFRRRQCSAIGYPGTEGE